MNNVHTLYDGGLTLTIPEAFCLTEDTRRYFQAVVPDAVFAWKEGFAAIGVTRLSIPLENADVEQHLVRYCDLYRRVVPSFADCAMVRRTTAGGTVIGAFQYTSAAIDRDLQNIFAILPVGGRETIITIACDRKAVASLGRKLMGVLNSIEA